MEKRIVELDLEATDGEEGLTMFKEFNPEFTLLNIIIPRMDGLTTLIEMKKVKIDSYIINPVKKSFAVHK
jgi:DNA-binding response OmpR family regulator